MQETEESPDNSRVWHTDEELEILSALDAVEYNPQASAPEDVEVLRLNGVPVATEQNLSCVGGDAGTGKSSLIDGAIAAITSPGSGDFLGYSRPPGTPPGLAIRFDCEQSRADHWTSCKRVRKRAGVDGEWDLFRSFCLTGWKRDEMLSAIELAVEEAHERSKHGVSLVVIDGYADLVRSINNEEECNDCVQRLVSLAIQYNTHVMGALHSNPISAKGQIPKLRGHLGSEIERKAETVLWMKRKSDGTVNTFTGKTRKAKIPESSAARMSFNEDAKRWETLKPAIEEKAEKALQDFRPLLIAAWGEDPEATYGKNELARIFSESAGHGLTWGKNKGGHAERLKLITPVTTSGTKKPFKLSPSGHALISASNPHE